MTVHIYRDPTNVDESENTPVNYDIPKSKTATGNLMEVVKAPGYGHTGYYSRRPALARRGKFDKRADGRRRT